MNLTDSQRACLFIECFSRVQAALVLSETYRDRPQAAAHVAQEHASAALREVRVLDQLREVRASQDD